MAERSPAPRRDSFGRGTLVVGLVLVTIAAALAAYGFAKLRRGPDVGTLVYAGKQGVFVHDLTTGHDRRIFALPSRTIVAEVSPDGRFVAYAQDQGQLYMYDRTKKDRYQIADRLVVPVGWSPDSRLIVREFASDGDLVSIDPTGGRKVLMQNTSQTMSTPIWIDEKRFAVGDPRDPTSIVIVDPDAEQPIVRDGGGVPLAASPDGTELIYRGQRTLRIAKVSPGGLVDDRRLFNGDIFVAATSTQGYVALAGKDVKGAKGIWVLQGGTSTKRVVSGAVQWLVWTRDGSSIVYEKDGALYATTIGQKGSKRVSRRGVDVFPLLSFNVVPKTGG